MLDPFQLWVPKGGSTEVCGVDVCCGCEELVGLIRSGYLLIFYFGTVKLETLVRLAFGSPGRYWAPVGYNGANGTTVEPD